MLRAFKALLLAMAWFVLMAEEGVESFKDFSFLSDPIGEVGVIIYIKEPFAFKTFPFNCTHSQH